MRQVLAEARRRRRRSIPLRILAAIAVNRSMPPTARVAACRALIAARDPERSVTSAVAGDAVSVRAQELWRRAEGQTEEPCPMAGDV